MRSFAWNGDFWSGLAFAGLGTWIVSQARGWTYMGEDGPGPGFFPLWYGSAMIVLSLLLVAGAVARRHATADRPGISWPEVRRAFLCWAALVASIALMGVIGFGLAFGLLTWFIVAVMARQPQRTALPIAVGAPLVFYAVFEWALDVALPHGVLF